MAYNDPADPVTQRRIDVSVGIKIAAELACATDNPIGNFATCVSDVVAEVLRLQDENAVEVAADALVIQFPGTTVTTATVPPWDAEANAAVAAPVQGYGPAPVSQPAAIPGASDGDPAVAAIWQEYFANPKKFWDNRAKIADGSFKKGTPEFKHKDDGDKAVWIRDKKNPSWVASNLASRGLG